MGKKQEYYIKLKELIQSVGDWNVDILRLAKEWDVPKSNLYRWRQEILDEIDLISPEQWGRDLVRALRSAIEQCQVKVRMAGNDADKARYMKVLTGLAETIMKIQEGYGHKSKVAEKVELSGLQELMSCWEEEKQEVKEK